MPAASNKVEQKPSAEALDPMKQCVNTLEKKVRNLEKRKSKLDTIRAKASAGESLEKEQQDAIKHYEEVNTNLEFARDLQKAFAGIVTENEKAQKKQAKREKQERAAAELKRVTDMLKIQTTLDSLGSDTVRDHFKTGKHGAVVLTEDNLNQLDELYQLINPSRDVEDFSAKLAAAGEHMISLLESRDRAVVGSTYKEMHELIILINDCGYFERAREAEESTEGAEAAAEETEETPAEAEVEETPAPLPQTTETFEEPVEPEPQNTVLSQEVEESSLSHSQVLQPPMSQESGDGFFVQSATQSSAFPAAPPQPQRARPLDEIVSSVQGTFNFLQDSVIDLDSPHMDPAVVAAQPMMRPPSVTQASMLQPPPAAFPSAPFPDSTVDQPAPSVPGREPDAQDPLSLSQQTLAQPNLDFVAPPPPAQTFGQAGLSHSQNLGSSVGDVLSFQSPVEDASKAATVSQQHSHAMLGQSRATSGESASQYELPPSIPMPPSQTQDGSQLVSQEKKFQMNASAPVFRSMYTQPTTMSSLVPPQQQQAPTTQPPPPPPSQQQPQQQQQQQPPPPQIPVVPQQDSRQPVLPPSTVSDFAPTPNFAQAAGDFSQAANTFQSGGFGRGGRGGGPGNFRGGPRGGPRGGGATNGNAMQNGFNPRPQSGGNRGGRGGSYQGFPPRNDYRPDGYQGFNGNGFGGPQGSYQKRGGPGGPGFPRGGGNNRGAGGMRGAPSRGGPPRGAPNRGGMVRQ